MPTKKQKSTKIVDSTAFPTDDKFITKGGITQNNYGDGNVKLYSLKI